jgi:membrane protease YdiL (CAAX protease family)
LARRRLGRARHLAHGSGTGIPDRVDDAVAAAGFLRSIAVLVALVAAAAFAQVAITLFLCLLPSHPLTRNPWIENADLRLAGPLLGLLLVAVSEELVFRRFFFTLLEPWHTRGAVCTIPSISWVAGV